MTIALPYGFARRHGVAITGGDDAVTTVALSDTGEPAALAEVRRLAGRPLAISRLPAAAFEALLAERYARALPTDTAALAALAGDIPSNADLLDSDDEAPVIRLINGLIAEAARQGASDIHFEPHDGALVVRMRADGQLAERHRLPAGVAPQVVSRIKVMARLDIAERRLPQDGRMSVNLAAKTLDVRVSTLPARGGERVVLRLLDKSNTGIGLDALGLPPALEQRLRGALAEPNGMVLVTGPTGSGKTTTLYAALRLLHDGSRNILTIEDPVEYAINGVGQTQVNPRVGLNFAAGLRAILRQDPDTVMVGEIRDAETAQIAVQAALTGHLLLSSVHSNDAAGAVTRLRDFGVEPFLLAATLRAVVAQRLVRRLCPDCRVAHPADPALAALIGIAGGTPVMAPGAPESGCKNCGGSGWQGRIGVFELLRVNDALRTLIAGGADDAAIAAAALGDGGALALGDGGALALGDGGALAQAARQLVLDGVTTAEEAVRVTRAADA